VIRVRGLKVWFSQRRGLLKDVLGSEEAWVKAVDGIDLDVRRREILCLVGESGCGKTTTGKALLRLAEPTEGDVLFEMPDDDYRRYEDARKHPNDPAEAATLEDLRRRFSFTWIPNDPWTAKDILTTTAAIAVAAFLALTVPALLVALLQQPFTNQWMVLGTAIFIGFVLGVVGSLPPSRPTRRTPAILALLALVIMNLGPLFALDLYAVVVRGPGAPFDIPAALGFLWTDTAFAILIGQVFAPGLAAGLARVILDLRSTSEGLAGIKIRSMRRRLHMIFQDPYESLNPKQSVFEIVSEPVRVNHLTSSQEETVAQVTRALNDAGLRPAEELMFRFPHELSGGQRQRVSIAAALALEPEFVVADEPVSMLDVSIRTDILQLLLELREKKGLTYLFITHDLGLAWVLADRIAVMYLGKIVEIGTAEQVIGHPKHPYTQALISVVPSPDPRKKVDRVILKGERPDPVNIPAGCRFHPRCPVAFERCGWTADEVVDELRSLQGQGMLAGIVAFQAQDSKTIGIALAPGASPEAVAESLRTFVAEHRSSRLALKGIAEVRVSGGYVYASMHGWSEPSLVELEAGNAAACHLVTPPTPTDVAVTA